MGVIQGLHEPQIEQAEKGLLKLIPARWRATSRLLVTLVALRTLWAEFACPRAQAAKVDRARSAAARSMSTMRPDQVKPSAP